MSKPKSPTLPQIPTFQANPTVGQAESSLMGLGQGLTSQNVAGLPQILQDTVSTNPQMTQMTLQALEAQLAGPLAKQRQDTINTLEANNQLSGSTTASALGNIDTDYQNQLISAGLNAGMADINRAMQNRVNLYGTGLNTIQAAGQLGLGNQGQVNSFNLDNYQNQVAKVLGEQKQQSGGILGGLMGAAGGALGGSVFGPVGMVAGGVLGGASGAMGPQSTGPSFLSAGAGAYGANQMGLGNFNSGLAGGIGRTESLNPGYGIPTGRSLFPDMFNPNMTWRN